MNKYFLILYVLLFCITCEGQDKSSNEFKLSEGIYLNNLNIIIPWIIDYREIETNKNKSELIRQMNEDIFLLTQ